MAQVGNNKGKKGKKGKKVIKFKEKQRSPKENKYQRQFSKFIENYRNTQKSMGYITTYPEHKRLCKGIGWEANEIINNFLWLGSLKSAQNIGKLYDLKITYILNCADDHFIAYNEHDFNYHCLKAKDKDGYKIIDYHLEDAIKFINKAKQEDGKILVHCIGGVNRSVSIVIGFLLHLQHLQHDNISLINATKLVLNCRPFALTNKTFQHQLLHHEQFLHKQVSKRQRLEKRQYKKNKRYQIYHDNDNDGGDEKAES